MRVETARNKSSNGKGQREKKVCLLTLSVVKEKKSFGYFTTLQFDILFEFFMNVKKNIFYIRVIWLNSSYLEWVTSPKLAVCLE